MARRPAEAPRDIEYVPMFEPDMERMVKALRILLEYQPPKEEEVIKIADPRTGRETSCSSISPNSRMQANNQGCRSSGEETPQAAAGAG